MHPPPNLPSCSNLTDSQPKAPVGGAPQTPAQSSSSASAPPAAPGPSSSNAPTTMPPTPSPAPASIASTTNESTNFSDPSALALGPQREAAVTNMESMGFPRAEIDRAMRAAFFNPNRAVEYLLNVGASSMMIRRAPDGVGVQPVAEQSIGYSGSCSPRAAAARSSCCLHRRRLRSRNYTGYRRRRRRRYVDRHLLKPHGRCGRSTDQPL